MKTTDLVARLIACVLALVALAAPSHAQPSKSLTGLTSDLVVQVRSFDKESKQEIETGCGLIIGSDENSITILTARHVIEQAITSRSTVRASVLFQGTNAWRDAEVGAPLGEAATIDATFIRVKRADAPFTDAPRCADLPISPAPESGANVHAFGLDATKGQLAWKPGVLNSASASTVRFDAKDIVGGYSGGILTSDVGVIAMTVRAGPSSKDHEALLLAPLLKLVRAAGGTVQVRENPALAALDRLFAEKLIAAMDVWDIGDRARSGSPTGWIALAPLKRDADSYTLDAVSTLSRAEVRMAASGSGLSLELAAEFTLGSRRNVIKLPRGSHVFEVDPSVNIPGFVVLKNTQPTTVAYLALPVQSTEMLAARGIFESATGAGPAKLTELMPAALDLSARPYLDRNPMPFSTVIKPTAAIEFRTPVANHRHAKVTIAGKIYLPDDASDKGTQAQRDAKKAAWTSLRLRITERQGEDKELTGIPLPWGKTDLRLTLDPMEKLLQIGVPDLDRRARMAVGQHRMLIQALRAEYQR